MHDCFAKGDVIPQCSLLQFFVEFDDFEGDFIGEDGAGFVGTCVFAPDCFEFKACVVADYTLDVFDVAGVEGWDDVVFDTHVFRVFCIVERE